MNTLHEKSTAQIAHSWWRKIRLAYVPDVETPLLDAFVGNLLEQFHQTGHTLDDKPQPETDVILTTARFNQPIKWREAMIFNARRRFDFDQSESVLLKLGCSDFMMKLVRHRPVTKMPQLADRSNIVQDFSC